MMRHRIVGTVKPNEETPTKKHRQKQTSATKRHAFRMSRNRWHPKVLVRSLLVLLLLLLFIHHFSSTEPLNNGNLLRWSNKSNKNQNTDPLNLRNLHLLMMGDSVTRYQYLSLAWYATYGTWYEPGKSLGGSLDIFRHHTFNIPFLPNGTWWNAYYWFTNQLLKPYEHCDCYKVGHKVSEMCENRYYFDPERNLSLSYVQAYGHEGRKINGHILAKDAFYNATQITTMKGNTTTTNDTSWYSKNEPFAWSYERWDRIITLHVAKLHPKPQIAVLNAGIWENWFSDDERIRANLVESLKNANIMGIWKTTTYRNDTLPGRTRWAVDRDSDPIMCKMLQGCINMSWTRDLADKSLWWDHHHFVAPIYRRMNEQMLKFLRDEHYWDPNLGLR